MIDGPHETPGGDRKRGRDAMRIEIRDQGPAVVLSPCGRLDAAGAPVLEDALRSAVARGNVSIVVECDGIDYISSTGIRTLLVGAKSCQAAGGALSVTGLQPVCRAVMEASGLLTVLNHRETTKEALAVSGRRPQKRAEGRRVLEIEEWLDGAVAVLALHGRLDNRGVSVLMERFSAVLKRGTARIVLDCENMSYVDSTGLRALLTAAKACQQEGGRFALASLQPQCRSVVEMSGFLSVIEFRESRTAAVALLGSG